MADVIDLALHRHLHAVLEDLLDERGISFFLKNGGRVPFTIDPRRVRLAVELAARRCATPPVDEAREAAYVRARKRLIAELAQAMVQVGL